MGYKVRNIFFLHKYQNIDMDIDMDERMSMSMSMSIISMSIMYVQILLYGKERKEEGHER